MTLRELLIKDSDLTGVGKALMCYIGVNYIGTVLTNRPVPKNMQSYLNHTVVRQWQDDLLQYRCELMPNEDSYITSKVLEKLEGEISSEMQVALDILKTPLDRKLYEEEKEYIAKTIVKELRQAYIAYENWQECEVEIKDLKEYFRLHHRLDPSISSVEERINYYRGLPTKMIAEDVKRLHELEDKYPYINPKKGK